MTLVRRIAFLAILVAATTGGVRGIAAAGTAQAPVVVYGTTLFSIVDVSDAAAQRRASIVGRRIESAAADPAISLDSIRANVNGTTATIVAGDRLMVDLTAADAAGADRSLADAASVTAATIRQAISDFREERSPSAIAVHGAISLGVLLLLAVATIAVWRLSSWLVNLFYGRSARLGAVGRAVGVEVPLRPLVEIAVSILRVLRLVVVGFLAYVCISFVLRQFPLTRDLSRLLIGPFFGALGAFVTGLVGWLPQLAIIVVIAFVAYEARTFLRIVRDEMQAGRFAIRGFEPDWVGPTYRLLAFGVLVFAIMAILPHMPGFDSPSFKAVGLLLSALFTFGSASTITNILGGVVLIYAPSFRAGDYIKIGDAEGEVVAKSLFVTQIRTFKNVVITMPNSAVIGATVYNYSAMALRGESGLILNSTITLGYDIPWRDVETALISAARKTSHIVADPAPFVLQTALNDNNVSYQINAYTSAPLLLARTYSELHANIQDACNAAGIEILSPAYQSLRDGNHTTIPGNFLTPDYRSPGFRVEPPNGSG